MPHAILNVSQNYYVRGGSDRYFFALTDLLQRHRHRVVPFASRQPGNLPTPWQRYFPRGVDFDAPGPRDLVRFVYSADAAKRLRRLLADEPIDLAHLHIYYGQLTASILPVLREFGVPIVQTVHDFKVVCPVYSLMSRGQICEACAGHKFWKAALKRCNRGSAARSLLSAVESYVSRWLGNADRIDHFIAVSNFQREKLIQLGLPPKRITTIHNFADTQQITPQTTPGEYLLYFGRLEKLKGIFTLAAAAARVPDVQIVVAGRGEAENELRAVIADRGIHNVRLVGFKQGAELEQLLRGSIATLIASEGYDNCPMSILESYSYARPVIGSRMGGIPELIRPNIDGLVFPPGDADALAGHLDWMFHHRGEAVEMGLRGRAKVEQEFNSEVHYQRLRAVYDGLAPHLHEQPIAANDAIGCLPTLSTAAVESSLATR
jgi:glycosyltransferase involved in cell wall biosynthesis